MQEESAPQTTIDERIQQLSSEIERAVRWRKGWIGLALYESDFVRQAAQLKLKEAITIFGQKLHELVITEKEPDVTTLIKASQQDVTQTIFIVRGLSFGKDPAWQALNYRREWFIEHKWRVLFWLTQNELNITVRQATDFWVFRHSFTEFTDEPTKEMLEGELFQKNVKERIPQPSPQQLAYLTEQMKWQEQSLTKLPEGGDAEASRAFLLQNIGEYAWALGDWEKATTSFEQAQLIWQKIGNVRKEGSLLNLQGLILLVQEQPKKAEIFLMQALNIYKQLDDKFGQAKIFHDLGTAAQLQQNWRLAKSYYQDALNFYENNSRQAPILHNLGVIAQEQGKWEEAEQFYNQAIKIYQKIGDADATSKSNFQLKKLSLARDNQVVSEKSVTVGERGVYVRGNIGGDVITGDNNIISTSYHSPDSAPLSSSLTQSRYSESNWIRVLQKSPTMQNRDLRNNVIQKLSPQIKNSLRELPTLRAQLIDLVKTCSYYEDGMKELVTIIELFEGNSFTVQELKQMLINNTLSGNPTN